MKAGTFRGECSGKKRHSRICTNAKRICNYNRLLMLVLNGKTSDRYFLHVGFGALQNLFGALWPFRLPESKRIKEKLKQVHCGVQLQAFANILSGRFPVALKKVLSN